MKYEVMLTWRDYVAGQRAGQPLFARQLPVTMAVLTAAGWAYMKATGRPIDNYTLLGVVLVWIAVFYLSRVWLVKQWVREFEESERTSYAVEMDEDGVKLKSEFEKAAWRWSAFCGWRDTRECFLLHYNEGCNKIIIPKSTFSTPEEEKSVHEFLQKCLGRPRG